jgi:hypothetical protein
VVNTLERVARAICFEDGRNPDSMTTDDSFAWEVYLSEAQAAIDAMQEWQPIETAPLGTDVLIYRPSHIQLFDVMRRNAVGNWRWPDGEIPLRDPTHWMPLPEPPK